MTVRKTFGPTHPARPICYPKSCASTSLLGLRSVSSVYDAGGQSRLSKTLSLNLLLVEDATALREVLFLVRMIPSQNNNPSKFLGTPTLTSTLTSWGPFEATLMFVVAKISNASRHLSSFYAPQSLRSSPNSRRFSLNGSLREQTP